MKTSNPKSTVRGLLTLTAVTALAASSVLTGCTQRARLRLPAPADSAAAGKTDTVKAADAAKPGDAATDAKKAPAPSEKPPVAGDKPATGDKPASPETDPGRRGFGEKGNEALAKLEKARTQIASDVAAMDAATKEGKVKVNRETEKLVSWIRETSPMTVIDTDLSAYCELMAADSRAPRPLDGEKAICAEIEKQNEGIEFEDDSLKVELCRSLKVVTKDYVGTHKAADQLIGKIAENPGFGADAAPAAPAADDAQFAARGANIRAEAHHALEALVDLSDAIGCDLVPPQP